LAYEEEQMATKVSKEETLELQDGTEVTIRPLNIKNLRKFMEVVARFEKLGEDEEAEDKSIDIMVDAVSVALLMNNKELAEDRDRLEEILDVPTMHHIMALAGGVDMSAGANADPNLRRTG
jgi:hypothetical protein